MVDAPLVLTYHTKYDIDIAKAVKRRLLQESAIRALVQNVNACDEVWVVSRGAGENLRSLGYEGEYTVMELSLIHISLVFEAAPPRVFPWDRCPWR